MVSLREILCSAGRSGCWPNRLKLPLNVALQSVWWLGKDEIHGPRTSKNCTQGSETATWTRPTQIGILSFSYRGGHELKSFVLQSLHIHAHDVARVEMRASRVVESSDVQKVKHQDGTKTINGDSTAETMMLDDVGWLGSRSKLPTDSYSIIESLAFSESCEASAFSGNAWVKVRSPKSSDVKKKTPGACSPWRFAMGCCYWKI